MQFTTFVLLAITGAAVATPLAPRAPASNFIHPNVDNNKCLTAASNSDGAKVTIQPCTGDASQTWSPQSGALRIFGDKCLDNTNGVTTNGNKLQIYTCFSGNTNQEWSVSGSTISLTKAKKCLDNTDGSDSNGNPAQIWDCTGGKNQKWNVTAATTTPPTTKGKAVSPGKSAKVCLTAASNADNAAVTIQNCDKSAGQSWSAVNGNLQIFGDKCLDVPNGSTTNGQKMQIFTCFKGNTNQQFTVTGDKRIAWTNKHECLDLTDGNTAPGNKIQMWKCTDNNDNQVWNFV